MSPYLAGGMLIAFIAWSGFMYYEGTSKETAVCKGADAQHDLAQANVTVNAEKGVIATIGKQQTVTQGVDYAFQAKTRDIDSLYADAIGLRSTPTPASGGMSAIPSAASKPHAAAPRPFRTRVFKLTAQECDENTEQLYGLQEWVKGQQGLDLDNIP